MTITASFAFILAAVVIFILAAFGVTIGSLGELDLACLGLGLFAAGHIL